MNKPGLPALVVAFLALLIALGGTSYAAYKINGKNIKNRTVVGAKLKKNTVTGREVREASLSRVPSAQAAEKAEIAQRANHATNAENAQKLGGRPADSFVDAARFTNTYTEVSTNVTSTILERGPFKLSLACLAEVTNGTTWYWAILKFNASEPVYTSLAQAGQDKLIEAGSQLQLAKTDTTINTVRFKTAGGYVDARSGQSMDFSVRVRVLPFGEKRCTATTQASFIGL